MNNEEREKSPTAWCSAGWTRVYIYRINRESINIRMQCHRI